MGSGLGEAYEPEAGTRAPSAGPTLDVLKHWISEKGVGLTLAHQIIKAQGGTLTASGLPGTSVQLSIRLPQERLEQVGLITAPRGLEVDFAQIQSEGKREEEEQAALGTE